VQTPTLSLFLAQALLLDATVQGIDEVGFHTPADISWAEARRVLAPMEQLPWPCWPSPAVPTFYAGDGAVAIVTGEFGGRCLVYVGGRTDADLEPLNR
jgi:hypothetical protein